MFIEEDISKLRQLKEFNKYNVTRNGKLAIFIEPEEKVQLNIAIEHLLAEREKDKKKIKNLEEKLLDTLKGTETIKKETPEYIKENYIPKQKIKDKIEELKKKDMTIYFGKRTHSKTFQQTVGEVEIKLLEELLEDK